LRHAERETNRFVEQSVNVVCNSPCETEVNREHGGGNSVLVGFVNRWSICCCYLSCEFGWVGIGMVTKRRRHNC